jgi:hypothetical protein
MGTWHVAREILRYRVLSATDFQPSWVLEGLCDAAVRRAVNYVNGVPADESRSEMGERYKRHEFVPSDDLDGDFVRAAVLAIGELTCRDTSWATAAYAVTFAQYAMRRAQTIQLDERLLDLAVSAYGVAVQLTEPSDHRFVPRAIALSLSLELRYSVVGDLRDLEAAVATLGQALYRLPVPDAGMARIHYRIAELRGTHARALGFERQVPEELWQASAHWPLLEPEYDQDLLSQPQTVLARHAPEFRLARMRALIDELMDDDGKARVRWGPGERASIRWLQVGDLAVSLDHEQTEDLRRWGTAPLDVAEEAYSQAIAQASAQFDEAAGQFGLVEVAYARWLGSSGDQQSRALTAALTRANAYPEQLGVARRRRVAEWEGEVLLSQGASAGAAAAYRRALTLEEQIFRRQEGLVRQIAARTLEPSDVSSRLALALVADTQCAEAVDVLERGRNLVFRALGQTTVAPLPEHSLPKCGPVAVAPDERGRGFSRAGFRTVSVWRRLGLRPPDEAPVADLPIAACAEVQRSLGERGGILIYLVPGPQSAGVLAVSATSVEFSETSALRLDRLAELERAQQEASATPELLDTWFAQFRDSAGAEVWECLDRLAPRGPLWLVPCGLSAALPWSGARPRGPRAVRHLGSAGALLDHDLDRNFDAAQQCEILVADTAVGQPDLKFGRSEALSVAAAWHLRTADVKEAPSATVATCTEALGRDTGVCHVICHAAASERDPLQQGLALADGRLLTADILASARPVRTRQVVLSACQSGRTAYSLPDEFISLASALVARGARGVVGNSWTVDDYLSSVVMGGLHALLAKGAHAADAVATVQTACRSGDVRFFKDRAAAPRVDGADEMHPLLLASPTTWATLHYVGL